MAKKESVADLRSEILFLKREVSKLLAIAMGETADAERWRFFDANALSTHNGARLVDWLGFDAVMEHGSRNAAIDSIINRHATALPVAGNGEGE
jgi:hypothetical protein